MPGLMLTKEYQKLLSELKHILDTGKARAQRAATQELVLTYWKLGEAMQASGVMDESRYGQGVVEDLAADLGLDRWSLRRAALFFKQYISAPRSTNLSWSHYKELLRLSDASKRDWYEEQASRENWSRQQLIEAMQNEAYPADAKSSGSARLKRPTDPKYLYKALVERVVDGDTLLLRIDLGFQVWKEQRIRLAGVDAPEIDTKDGQKAAALVNDLLAPLEVVVVKTHKIDIYGRYVGHIFYSSDERDVSDIFLKGVYLNQFLVEKNFIDVI